MQIIYPEYYEKFQCLAAQCPDSCCKEWEVDIDPVTAEAYRRLPGPLGDRLRQVMTDYDGGVCMRIEDGRCPMWRDDSLCRIQAELGHDALCHICRTYPRLRQDYGDFVQLGLELSCPEAARLIFAGGDLLYRQEAGGEANYDAECMAILSESRAQLLRFWQQTQLPLGQALAVTLLYAHGVQDALDGGEAEALDAQFCLAQAKSFAGESSVTALYEFFRQLEILTPRWGQALNDLSPAPVLSRQLQPLAVYFIRRYWLEAVWDLDLVCRVKFLCAACLIIAAAALPPMEAAQLFSKEIENCDDNLDAILDAAYTHPAFTDAGLLGALLA